MKKIVGAFRKELYRLIPLFFFFFVIFSLADIVKILKREETGEAVYSFMTIVISSLMMAKVIILADFLPVIERYSHKPLIYNTFWKTLIYLVCSFFFRVLDRALPTIFEGKGLALVYEGIIHELTHIEFWIPQLWLLILFFILVAYRELIYAVGVAKVRQLFFGE